MHLLLVRLYITYVKAISSYNDLRNLVLQSAPRLQTLRVYVSENERLQAQWILSDLFQDLETNLTRKVRQRGKLWLDSAKDLHKEVWPDRQVADIKVSFKCKTEKAQQSKKDWKKDHAEDFDQNAVPTTIMVCILFLLATNVKRLASARELAVTMLRRVCRLVCEASHGITLDGISLDQNGKILNASTLWPSRSSWDHSTKLGCRPTRTIQLLGSKLLWTPLVSGLRLLSFSTSSCIQWTPCCQGRTGFG